MSYQSPKVTIYDINGNALSGGDNSTNSATKIPVIVGRANTAAPTWTDGYMVPLSVDTAGALRITGSISATNPSVSTNGSAVPASSTYIGGEVTTAAPAYTNGTLDALSLTTSGALRIDGSAVTQPVSGTVTANIGTSGSLALESTQAKVTIAQGSALGSNTQTMVGGSVTTAAPTYTTGNINPLSLTTSGALRIDGSGVTQPVSGTVTANIGTSGSLALESTQAKLTIALSTALGSNTQVMVGGSVTTAAPTYTTGNINPLSLLTTGALRTDISSWIGSTAPTIGSKTSANSIPVVVASDQGAITVNASATVGLVDNAAFTDGTTRVQPSGYIFDEVAGTALTENDSAAARIDSKRAQVCVIEDTTTRGTRTTVKAASTAAVATDTALVVAISPNNSFTISSADTTSSGTLNALNATASISLTGQMGSAMQLLAGTLIGTIVPEVSIDGGTTWVQTFFDDPSTGNIVSSIVFASNNTATTRTIVGSGGASNTRIRVSAFTSGTATCNMRASDVIDASSLENGPAAGALPAVMSQVGGSVTTAAPTYTTGTLNALSLNTAGALRTTINSTIKPLYGTNNQTITITLASLANAAARASTVIDNTSTLYDDANIFIKVTTAAAGTSTTGFLNVYGYGTVDGGTTYPEAITGTDAGITLTSPPNLVLIAQVHANTNAATKTYGPFSFCRMYGLDRLPAKWGIVITNSTGATLNATAGNFSVTYQGINGQLV
jgi:hypothetical protein